MIDEYSFGRIVIGGQSYGADVIIYPDRVDAGWWRRQGHSLCLEDLAGPLAAAPAVLVIGQGQPGLMKVPEEVRQEIEARGIELIVAPTQTAVNRYNELSPARRVVAGLHLTC